MSHLNRLLEIMETLRSENGCPWDREQTLETLRPYAVEEVYEVLDAIDRGDVEDHREELGDLLLQVVFHAQLRKEEGAFTFEDVAEGISEKLIRRHPHVFGDVQADTPDQVLVNWEAIKQQEKSGKDKAPTLLLDRVPVALPGLLKAHEMQKTSAKVGFDWPDASHVWSKLEEELAELREAMDGGDASRISDELGDVLFVLANLGRHAGVQAEQALQDACSKFRRRFSAVENGAAASGKSLNDHTLEEMDVYWNQAKADER